MAPAGYGPQVPSGRPVCAIAQPMHDPVQGPPQHTPSGAHDPLEHWSLDVQDAPGGLVPRHVPASLTDPQ